MLFMAFLFQSIAIGYLLYYTKQQQRAIMAAHSIQEQENTAVFSKENSILTIILIIFDVTYLFRGVWDATQFGLKQEDNPFALTVISISLGFFFDVIPIALVLLFHYRNFSVSSNEEPKPE